MCQTHTGSREVQAQTESLSHESHESHESHDELLRNVESNDEVKSLNNNEGASA